MSLKLYQNDLFPSICLFLPSLRTDLCNSYVLPKTTPSPDPTISVGLNPGGANSPLYSVSLFLTRKGRLLFLFGREQKPAMELQRETRKKKSDLRGTSQEREL